MGDAMMMGVLAAKVAEFGIKSFSERKQKQHYRPPEAVLGATQTKEADVYAFGKMVYEMFSRIKTSELASSTPADINDSMESVRTHRA
jgi:hypothetical protein